MIVSLISIFFYLIPFALISGPFLPDFLISIIGILFIFYVIKNKHYQYFNNNFFKIFLIFYLYIVIRSLFSANLIESFQTTIFYFRFSIFVLATYFLIENSKNFIRIFSLCLLSAITLVAVDGIFQFFYGYNLIGLKQAIPDRVGGLFGKESILGSYIVRLTPLLFALLFINFDKKFFFNYAICFILIILNIAVYISGERTSFFLMILFDAIFLTLIRINFILKIFSVLLIFLLIFTFSIYKKSISDRMFNQVYESVFKEKKINIFSPGHQLHYQAAFKMFQDNYIFGQGVKMFRFECSKEKYYNDNKYVEGSCSTHPHNTYIQFLAETGIFGFFFIFLCFFYILYNLYKNYQKLILYKKANIPLVLILSNIFINLFPFTPTGNFFGNWLSVLYYLPVGFYLSSIYKSSKSFK
jgi:O-antigen ligase